MHHTNWIVQPDDDGIRPAGQRDACFFCGQRVGKMHAAKCGIPERTVVLAAADLTGDRHEFVVRVADHSDPALIEYLFNEHLDPVDALRHLIGPYRFHDGWWVADKVYAEGKIHVEYVREATVLDEERSGVRVPVSSSEEHMRP